MPRSQSFSELPGQPNHARPGSGLARSSLSVGLAGLLALLPLAALPGEGPDKINPPIGPARLGVEFSRRCLEISANEGSAVADIDRDGHLDVVAGRNWYRGPDYVPRPLREIGEFDDYLHSNGDHVHDVDADGWPDVIASSFLDEGVWWYENPGRDGLSKGLLWKSHLLRKTHGENEVNYLRDIDGDGVPELIVNRWRPDSPLVAWTLERRDDGSFTIEPHELCHEGNNHGMAFGDIDGDGREDILSSLGWWQRPAGSPLESRWTFHRDWNLGAASCPMLVLDLTGDGRNDLVWGKGHDYGLYWREQLAPAADGKTEWREHVIDTSYSQPHCLHWADVDGDGKGELITGKRVRAHSGKDPGGKEPSCFYYYAWEPAARSFLRFTIDEGGGVGTGLQISTADLDADGHLDIVVGGKSGTWILMNQGRPRRPGIGGSS